MTDESIIRYLHGNDERGLTAAVDKYSRLVRSVAAAMLSSEEDRDEVVSDTFFKVWRTRENIDPERGSLKTYICTVARSCTLSKLKKVSRNETLSLEERDLGIDVDFSTEEAAEHNRRIIAECIRSLPYPDRDVFICRFYYSLPLAEIAERLGITVKKTEYIISRSKRALRSALSKGGILL